MLDRKDHCQISYKKVCRSDDKQVEQKDIVKGYEYEKGKFVILEDKDFKMANAKKTSTVDIVQFSDIKDIEPKFYEKPYFIEPDKKATKAYVLLRDALEKSGKVGIARFVMKDREHIAAILVDGKALLLVELRFEDELNDTKDLKIPGTSTYTKKEVDMAISLVDQLTEPFKPSDFEDTYTDELMEVIKEKAKGKTIKAPRAAHKVTNEDVHDLLSMLKKSLEASSAR